MTEPKKAEPWWATYLTLVPRETYLRATRLVADLRASRDDERTKNTALHHVVDEQRELIAAHRAQDTVIRASLLRLPVYQGLVGPMPLTDMVAELARDHEELESRIEAVLDVILTRRADGLLAEETEYQTLNKIAGLLQGQIPRVPDTIEGIDRG